MANLFEAPTKEDIRIRERAAAKKKRREAYQKFVAELSPPFINRELWAAYLAWRRDWRTRAKLEQARTADERNQCKASTIARYYQHYEQFREILQTRNIEPLDKVQETYLLNKINDLVSDAFSHASSIIKCYGLYMGDEALKMLHGNFVKDTIKELRPDITSKDLTPPYDLVLRWNYASLEMRKNKYISCRHPSSSCYAVCDEFGKRAGEILTCTYCWRQADLTEEEWVASYTSPSNQPRKYSYTYGRERPWEYLNEVPYE